MGLLLGLLALIVVVGLAISGVISPTTDPPAAFESGGSAPSAQGLGPASGQPPDVTRPDRPQVGTQPGSRGVRPVPADRTQVGPVPAGVDLQSAKMIYAGLQRTWLLASPKHEVAGQRLPLLMDLHGRESGPRFASQQSGLLSWVAAGQAIAVFPTGYEQSWNADGCCGMAARSHVNDLGFLRTLALRLAARPDVDASQLAVLGFSNGGRMALDLACSRYLSGGGLTLRAVVAVESINSSRCVRGPGIPTLVTAGTDDPFVGYDEPTHDPEGGRLPSAQQEISAWSSSEGCATPETYAGVFPRMTFNCGSGPLNLVTIPGGRHRWPPAINPTIDSFLRSTLAVPAT